MHSQDRTSTVLNPPASGSVLRIEPTRRYSGTGFKPFEPVRKRMSVSGLCQICETRPARERCENCGTLVCELHYDREMGLCADCAARARSGERAERTDVHRFL